MPYVIKVLDGYVKNGKKDTEKLSEAKTFATEKQAKTFALSNCAGSYYKVIELPSEQTN